MRPASYDLATGGLVRGHRWQSGRRAKVQLASPIGYRTGVPIVLPPFEDRLSASVAYYWTTLNAQASKQKSGAADQGRRADVTGGKQMDGFCSLVHWVLTQNGMTEASIYVRSKLELPGYFRPTKQWDMLLVHEGYLLAAIEFKSQRGPSFGNNFNNRTEEALGNATDLWTAYREGAFGKKRSRPWLGWVMLLEDHRKSAAAVDVDEPHFKVFPEFRYPFTWFRVTRAV